MTHPSSAPLYVWRETTTPHRVCGRRCRVGSSEGLTYSTGSERYDQVCGRIIGYQRGATDAFSPRQTINSFYVSVTRGSPRQHIWDHTPARVTIWPEDTGGARPLSYACHTEVVLAHK